MMLNKISFTTNLALVLAGLTVFSATRAHQNGTSTDRLQLPIPEIAVIAQLPRFGEGVVFDAEGQLYVSDPFANAVLRISEAGEPEVWAEVQMPNGHKVLPDGTHVVLEQGEDGGAVVHLNADGEVIRRLETDDEGRLLRFPNDITLDLENGGFYFTDPGPFMGGEDSRVFYVDSEWQMRTVVRVKTAASTSPMGSSCDRADARCSSARVCKTGYSSSLS